MAVSTQQPGFMQGWPLGGVKEKPGTPGLLLMAAPLCAQLGKDLKLVASLSPNHGRVWKLQPAHMCQWAWTSQTCPKDRARRIWSCDTCCFPPSASVVPHSPGGQ